MASAGLRVNNERAVLTAVAVNPGASAADIARMTGLGAQSVSRILNELEVSGLIFRGEARRDGQRGQPAVPIFLDPNGAYCIGCEIGWQHLHVLIRNLNGEVLGEHRRDYAYPDARTIFEEVASISKLLVGLIPDQFRSRLLGLGLAMPSGFDIARNSDLLGALPEESAAWHSLDVAKAVEAATGLEVFLFNDGNAACWGELAAYPPPRPNNLAYFLIGTFVGAGLIAEGRLWEGPTGNSANLGSMLVTDRQGKQNFVHLIASVFAFERRLAEAGIAVPTGNPADWYWEAFEPHVTEWLEDAGWALAKTIANTAAVMEFNIVVIDGVMPRPIVHRLIESVRRHNQALPVLTTAKPLIEEGHLGATAPAHGAALKPMYRRLFSRDSADISIND